MKQLHLLVSSMSNRGRSLTEGRKVVQVLRQSGWKVTITVTAGTDDLGATAKQLPGALVGAIGGDGYLAAIGGALAEDPEKTLVPLPGGRRNDQCRALGIPMSAQKQAQRIANGETTTKTIDGMWVEDKSGRTFALGVVSLGVDAHANQVANRSSIGSGPLAYGWGAVHGLFRYRPQVFETSLGSVGGWAASISNSGWIGGGVNLVPGSDLNDGTLEVLEVMPAPRWRVLPTLAKVLAARNVNTPLVKIVNCQSISVDAPAGVAAMADGDVVAHTPFTVAAAPGALRVLV